MKIIIVDDVSTNRKLLGAILEAEGHEVTQANDGIEALASLEAEGADAIISDILMPNMDGYRLCLEVRQSEKFHQIPFIAYTATYVSAADEQVALELGADAYVRKPAPVSVLLESLRLATALRYVSKASADLVQGYSEKVNAKLQQGQKELASKTRITKLNQQLQKSNKKLSEFDRFKSEFLSTASHEMRTPLTIIREFASLLVDGVAGPINEEQSSSLSSILRNCDRLTCLINDLLDLARIESGKITLQRESLDIARLLAECVSDFGPRSKAKSQTLTLDLGADPIPHVLADRSKMIQVMVNLIGNALKFTDHGGLIGVSARLESGAVHICVSDNGAGIDKPNLEAVFDAFTQVNREDGPGMRGTGLGLTITRKIVEYHDGRISVQSMLGEGATFTFCLPIYSARLEQNAFLVDQSRSARSDLVCTAVTVFPSAEGETMSRGKATAVKHRCDAAMPANSTSSTISEDGLCLYLIESEHPISPRELRGYFDDVPEVEIGVLTDFQSQSPSTSIRSLNRVRARLDRQVEQRLRVS